MDEEDEEYAPVDDLEDDDTASSHRAAGSLGDGGSNHAARHGGSGKTGGQPSSSSSSAATKNGEGAPGSPDSSNIAKIIVATDCHIGFMEKDPIRGMDSFLAFEEVLKTAREHQADMVLLAGDLFHENKPSRFTMFKTMQILRRYVFGYNPIKVQIISDQAIHFGAGSKKMGGEAIFNTVNWEDPNFNVDLPIFSIHGNHDDPVREAAGASEELLAALDLLSVSNLINYFGRCETADKVDLYPILLVKGDTKIALYGLGAMRDDRFQRLLIGNSVQFHRPNPDEADDYFSIFMIHQNRENRGLRTKMGNTSAEALLPAFLDLVIWGHEHECIPVPEKKDPAKATYVLQPGSTVATSLSEGEAAPKHCFLVEVRGTQYRATPIRLRNVRPFGIRQLSLVDDLNLDPSAHDADERVRRALESQARKLIDKTIRDQITDVAEDDRPPKEMRRPLIRLKVDYSGFTALSNQRFGAVFSSEVANPQDMLLFWRKPQTAARKVANLLSARAAGGNADLDDDDDGYGDGVDSDGIPIMPRALNAEVRVETLVAEQLRGAQLSVLEFDSLTEGLHKYVQGEAGAIKDTVAASMSDMISFTKAKMPDLTNSNKNQFEELLRDRKAEQKVARKAARAGAGGAGGGAGGDDEVDGDGDDDDGSTHHARPGQQNSSSSSSSSSGYGYGYGDNSAARLDGSGGDQYGANAPPVGRIAASKAKAMGSRALLEADPEAELAAERSKQQRLMKTGRGGAQYIDEDEAAAEEEEENERLMAEAIGVGDGAPGAPASSKGRSVAAAAPKARSTAAAVAGKSSRGGGTSSRGRGGSTRGGAASKSSRKKKGSSDEDDDDEESEDEDDDDDDDDEDDSYGDVSGSEVEDSSDDDDDDEDDYDDRKKKKKKPQPAKKASPAKASASTSTRGRGGARGGASTRGGGRGGASSSAAFFAPKAARAEEVLDLTQDGEEDHHAPAPAAAPVAGVKRTAKAAGLPPAPLASAAKPVQPRDPSTARKLPW